MKTVREGQPFTVTYQYSTGGTTTWKIALDSIACGSGSIFDPKILTAYYSGEGQPTVIPQPAAGQKFCLVKFAVTNEGDHNDNWQASLDATVNVGMNERLPGQRHLLG
jgi:hypothetical protein